MSKDTTHVAVVDDDESFARAQERLLRASGFQVHIYASAEDFLALAPHPQPDCLLLDIQLGGMSGLDLRRRLRELGRNTPVIFVTAYDLPEIRAEALRVGCVAYLRKPVARQALLEAIAEAARPKEQQTDNHL